MKTTLTLLAALALSLAGAVSAQTPERHQALALAEAVDRRCGLLPYVEHLALGNLVDAAVKSSNLASIEAKNDDGTLRRFYDGVVATAATVDCGEAAASLLTPLRADVVLELGVAVRTAVIRKALSGLDPFAFSMQPDLAWYTSSESISEPSEDQMQSATALGGYVEQQFGANTPSALAMADALARARINADPSSREFGWSNILYHVDYQRLAEGDRRLLAAGPGRSIQRLRAADGSVAWSSRRAAFGTYGTSYVYVLVRDGQLFAAAGDGGSRKLTGLTGLRAYIGERGYDLTPTTETAFGASLYALPPEATAAVRAAPDESRLWVSLVRGAEEPWSPGGSSRADYAMGDFKVALAN